MLILMKMHGMNKMKGQIHNDYLYKVDDVYDSNRSSQFLYPDVHEKSYNCWYLIALEDLDAFYL